MTDTEQTEKERPEVTLVGFYLEVEAENERELGDKLYGFDDLEAEAELAGIELDDLREECDSDDEMWEEVRDRLYAEGYTMEDVEELQEKQTTANKLLRNAVLDGCPVLFKTNGTNLGYPSGDYLEVPHFGHSATCSDDSCWDEDNAGGVYRVFTRSDLIVHGDFSCSGRYRLRDGIRLYATSTKSPGYGEVEAERISPDKKEVSADGER